MKETATEMQANKTHALECREGVDFPMIYNPDPGRWDISSPGLYEIAAAKDWYGNHSLSALLSHHSLARNFTIILHGCICQHCMYF